MIQEPPSKTWIVVIVAIISTAGVICAALIGLGLPFASRLADRYFPTYTPPAISVELPISGSTEPAISVESPISGSVEQENLGENLILDGSFESGLGNWSYSERHIAGLMYPVAGYSGNSVCSRQNLTENEEMGWVGIGRDVLVQAGKSYKYSAWVKWENVTAFNAHIEWGIPTQYLPAFQVVDGTNNTWQFWEATFTVPNDVTQLRLAFWHGVKNNQTNVAGGIMCVDEVSLQQIN